MAQAHVNTTTKEEWDEAVAEERRFPYKQVDMGAIAWVEGQLDDTAFDTNELEDIVRECMSYMDEASVEEVFQSKLEEDGFYDQDIIHMSSPGKGEAGYYRITGELSKEDMHESPVWFIAKGAGKHYGIQCERYLGRMGEGDDSAYILLVVVATSQLYHRWYSLEEWKGGAE
jgi:hypothetical protein